MKKQIIHSKFLPFKRKETANNAFTLVELIVVITILAILWTIAFISLQWYSSQSRDSVRISDISRMKTAVELFQLDAGKYPLPTDGTEITYSGWIVWTQWYFWESTYKNVGKLDKIPLDPLTNKKYVYSTTNTRQEYQIAWVMEGEEVTSIMNNEWWIMNNGISQANAWEKTAKIKISWNYNWKLLKVSTGSIDYVLAVPSIITNTWITDVVSIVTNGNLAYNGYKNLPYQYNGSRYKTNWDGLINLMNAWDLVVFSWALEDLSNAETLWINARKTLLENLQNAYTGTTIKNVWAIARILSTDTTNTWATELLTTNIVSNNLGGSIIASSSSSWWWNNTPIGPYASCTWTNTWTILSATSTYGSCNTADIIVCSWNGTWYTIAACNVWTNTASTAYNDTNWYWELFQWWNNAWIKTAWTSPTRIWTTTSNSTYSNATFISSSSLPSPYDWTSIQNDNLWWNGTNTVESRIWPCLTWYHVPTHTEWVWIHTAWWWLANWLNMSNALKLPMAGLRSWNDASLSYQGTIGYYWSSSPNGTNGYLMLFNSSNINPSNNNNRANGFSVRCFKN